MNNTLEMKYGFLTLTNILSSVWLGDWDLYEKILSEIPRELAAELPFHAHYNREEVDLWFENHFFIPGDYFISPYYSSYVSEENDERNSKLLRLIGIYESVGFYFPLDKKIYPDHIGCLNTFLESSIREELAAEEKMDQEFIACLQGLREEILTQYLLPLQNGMKKAAENKIQHPYLKEFFNFYMDFIEKDF